MGVGLFISNTITGAPAIQILMLALAPACKLSMARGKCSASPRIMEVLPDWKTKLLADGWIWTFLAAIAPVLGLWNSLVALFSNEIRWRGIRYKLISPQQTRILTR